MKLIKFFFSKTFLIQIGIAILTLILLVFLLLQWLKVTTNHDQKIEVPDLAKLDLDIVEMKLNEMNLRFEVLDSATYNPSYPAYSVIDQIPAKGSYVKENRKLYLTINPSDYPKIQLPDNILDNTLRQVEPYLLSMGFKIGEVKKKPYYAKNRVLHLLHNRDTLVGGDFLKKNSIVDIIIGDGSITYAETLRRETQGKLSDEEINQLVDEHENLPENQEQVDERVQDIINKVKNQ